MRSHRTVAVTAVVVLAVGLFVVTGIRYVPGVLYTVSPPICGPLSDANGNPNGDAGPCPTVGPPLPPNREPRWEWAPFWVASD